MTAKDLEVFQSVFDYYLKSQVQRNMNTFGGAIKQLMNVPQ